MKSILKFCQWYMEVAILITRIIQSLYYAPAGRYSENADRGHSIIQVTILVASQYQVSRDV